MAPSPEHDNEPKAPDKNDNKSTESNDIRTSNDFLDDHLSSSNHDLDSHESSVSTLDDGQLKALLDEAINYKTPKDREGKSHIFKVLLQEAEEDERNARAASASGPQLARYYNTTAIGAARRHRNRKETTASSTLTHGGSLQDLAQSDLYTDSHTVGGAGHSSGGRRSGGRRHRQNHHGHHPVTGQKTVFVSARQREGGSLPTNVNAGARNLFDDYDSTAITKTTKITKSKKDECKNSVKDKENTSNNFTDSRSTKISDKKSIEPVQDSQIPIHSSAIDSQQTQNRSDYTIVELGDIQTNDNSDLTSNLSSIYSQTASNNTNLQSITNNIDLSMNQEETRSLLTKETRNYLTLESNYQSNSGNNASGNSNDVNLPKYRYPHGDMECGNDKDETTENATCTIGKRNQNYDQITRHQYFNPLDAIHQHRIPRIKCTTTTKLEVDGLNTHSSSTNVEKTITFSQFSTDREVTNTTSLQLSPEYNSVKCIVDGTSTGALSSLGGLGGDALVQNSTVTGRTHPLTKLSSDYRLVTVPNMKHIDRLKGLDENGNSVQTTNSSSTSSFDAKKKPKKSKVDKKVYVFTAEKIAGHQTDIINDIDQLVKYIEDDADKAASSNNNKGKHSHHKSHENHVKNNIPGNNACGTKIQTLTPQTFESKKPKRVKTKSETNTPKTSLKKSNSLEEISKTKFDDLMNINKTNLRSRVKKQSTSEDGDKSTEMKDVKDIRDRRSWGSEDSQHYLKHRDSLTNITNISTDLDTATALTLISQETAEFHVVTKKKKSKKRTTSTSSRQHIFDDKNTPNQHERFTYQYHKIEHGNQQGNSHHGKDKDGKISNLTTSDRDNSRSYHRHTFSSNDTDAVVPTRRKSACSVPPSDKSADSSDVDSVHSLPAATTRRKTTSNRKSDIDDQNLLSNSNNTSGCNDFSDDNGSAAATSPNSTSYADIARNNNGQANSFNICTIAATNTVGAIHQQISPQQSTAANWKPAPVPTTTISLRSSEHFPELCSTSDIKSPEIQSSEAPSTVSYQRDEFPTLDHHQNHHHRSLSTGSTQNYQQAMQGSQSTSTSSQNINSRQSKSQENNSISGNTPSNQNIIINTSVVNETSGIKVTNASNNRENKDILTQNQAQIQSLSDNTAVNTNCFTNNRRTIQPVHNNGAHRSRNTTGATSRPAVIILNETPNKNDIINLQSSNEPIQVSGLTFGFELNEQLLNNCVDNDTSDNINSFEPDQTINVGELFSARFLPPNDHRNSYNHDKIVQFIGMAWDELMQDHKENFQYYNGQ